MSTLSITTKLALTAATAALAATAPAHAGQWLCIPDAAGAPLTSGGADGTCEDGATSAQMPASAAEQQALVDLLPHVRFEAEGTGGKPTLHLRGLNVRIASADDDHADGTGNLVIGADDYLDGGLTGTENLVVGAQHVVSGTANVVTGAQQTVEGQGALVGGSGNTVRGAWNVVAGSSNTVLERADAGFVAGSGRTLTDRASIAGHVYWARFDIAGNLVASNHPTQYTWGSGNGQALVQFKGLDPRKCAIDVSAPETTTNMTGNFAAGGVYYDQYVYARSYTTDGQHRKFARSALDVVLTCAPEAVAR